jgi:hypothetical protein
MRRRFSVPAALALVVIAATGFWASRGVTGEPRETPFDRVIKENVRAQVEQGRQIFRFDTFGDEEFWGDRLRLHEAIQRVSPRTALAVGLKVDVDALPGKLRSDLRHGRVDLDDPANTVALLKLNAVVGVTGFFDESGRLRTMGIQCALCHSTVDDSFAPAIGRRLDGWAPRDLNVGAIIALAPNLTPVADLLGVSEGTLRAVLNSWGPGKFDAEVFMDGKALPPSGGPTLIPPAFGLAGGNLHTWTGWGSVTHWNAFVANLEMHGKGTFYDPRLNDPVRFPIAAANGFGNVRNDPDRISSKLAALHQLAIPAPTAPEGSFDRGAAARGRPRRSALRVTSRRSSPSRAGICTAGRKSGSITCRRIDRLTGVTGRLRSRASGVIRRVAFTTMGGSQPFGTWSTTITLSKRSASLEERLLMWLSTSSLSRESTRS